ncbi:hypothetical protein TEA_005602 [Camellia sinensis var. sinensis]|uniref:Uncharacterized protein n=1 Tax=Camellia sinensis var. sinensis TaxID=542762 RepID=A0A4V3WPE2_CAMSN|nr:hypothetical protein TEA_005602 [Camellia sinensis var. sinensis]
MISDTIDENSQKNDEKKLFMCAWSRFGGCMVAQSWSCSSGVCRLWRCSSRKVNVVSPEFTFYDSSKSSLDDSSHGEKLLRAKMDFSLMYASKENDTWIWTLVKDLTVEAGSGLIVLDPVDISGGYTSVNDKTSVSLAALALQLGNTDPMAPCTNFDRLWVSPKESGCHNNLTFWRPRAPSNYVILGDCVTSRSIPPSQAVLAVSNTYGRVRKPLGFKLIGLFSDIQGLEAGEGQSDVDGGCSLWIPVAPPGYLALGCNVYSVPPLIAALHMDLAYGVQTMF